MNEPILLFKMIGLFVGYFSFEISLIFLDWYVNTPLVIYCRFLI